MGARHLVAACASLALVACAAPAVRSASSPPPGAVTNVLPASGNVPQSTAITIDLFPDPPQGGQLLVIAVAGVSPGERVALSVTPGAQLPEIRATVDRLARFSLVLPPDSSSWTIVATSGGVVLASRTATSASSSVGGASPLPPQRPLTTPATVTVPPVLSPGATTAPLPPGLRVAFDPLPAGSQAHPDHALAVGPKSITLVGNGQIAITDKFGGLIASTSVSQFFDPVRLSGEGVGDPWMTFDAGSGRFFYVADGTVGNGHVTSCVPGDCKAHHLLAVSKTDDPRSLRSADWYFYALDRTLLRTSTGVVPTATWGDYDHVVVGDETVLIKWPAYAFGVASGGAGQSQGVRVRMIAKTALLSGAPVDDWTDLQLRDPNDGSLWIAPVEPAIGSGQRGTPFYLLGMRGCGVVVWALQDRASAPQSVVRELPASGSCAAAPADAPQPGGDAPIDVLPFGHNVVYRAGTLWYAHVAGRSLGATVVSEIRVLAVDLSAWPGSASIVQDWTYGDASAWELAPALMIDGGGDIVILFGRTSPTEYASLYYAYRTPADPPGTLRPAVLQHAGDGSKTTTSPATGSRNRFVDFFVAALDPVDGTVWTYGAFIGAGGTRRTWLANVTVGVR